MLSKLGRRCSTFARRFSVQAPSANQIVLPANSNQALGIAEFAIDFMGNKYEGPSDKVMERVELFHTDSVFCGLSAIALETNAPNILRDEAQTYPRADGATCFGSKNKVAPEKAILANSNAVREWDSNGTVFGYRDGLGKKFQAGEFGHNDFYPVCVAAGQMKNLDGKTVLKAMVLSDEIRGRLAEVFSLKSYKIDHVVHGAIASAAVYGAMMGATAPQIEAAIGMTVAHYIPWRAIRAGHQLSDSKGASAAISTEAAIMSVHRAMRGFLGPKDIFRNPESIFRFFEPTTGAVASKDNVDITLKNKERWGPGDAPFDLVLSHSGDDFAAMGMHFKLGLYEHQSAGAIQALIDAIRKSPDLVSSTDKLEEIKVQIYQVAYGIIGDPAKRNPTTRQSADHSMVFILSSLLKKAFALGPEKVGKMDNDTLFKAVMLAPEDYSQAALTDPTIRKLMDKIVFEWGGPEYDENYPDGIPTSVTIKGSGQEYSSGMVMYPSGHARNTAADLKDIMNYKFKMLGDLCVANPQAAIDKLSGLTKKGAAEVDSLYDFDILPNKTGEKF